MQVTLKGEFVFKTEISTPVRDNPDFTKREVWLEIDQKTEYPQTVPIELIKDKCGLVDKFSIGDIIEIDVNVRGNRATMKDGTERCFGSFNGWRANGTASGNDDSQGDPQMDNTPPPPASAPPTDNGGGFDDLPF